MSCPSNPCYAISNPTLNNVFIGEICIPPNGTVLARRISAAVTKAVVLGFVTVTSCGGEGEPDCLALLENHEYYSGPTAPDPEIYQLWFNTTLDSLFAYTEGVWRTARGETDTEVTIDLVAIYDAAKL